LDGHRRDGSETLRQERLRIDVPLVVGRAPDAEVDVRLCEVAVAALSGRADDVAFGNLRAFAHADRAEMRERHRPAVGRLDRERPAARGHRADEGDEPTGRRKDGRAGIGADVEAAVLPAGVRMRRVEVERLQDRPVDGPRPGAGKRRRDERE
jgi:hypothetical protein